MNSYQKLKKQNAELIRDIEFIVRNPNTIDGFMTHKKWSVKFQVEDQIMAGSASIPVNINGWNVSLSPDQFNPDNIY